MDQNLRSSDLIFKNPYILSQIVSKLDIRSLFENHCLSKDFFDASVYEYERRKDIVHLYLLNYDKSFRKTSEECERLFESFIHFTQIWLNIRPKRVLVLIGGYKYPIDYRQRGNPLKSLAKHLSKECRITYIDVGHSVLTSSIKFKSLTNYSEYEKNDYFQRTAFSCICINFYNLGINSRLN